MKEINQLVKKYIKESTVEEPIFCAVEEMSEATKVLTKFLRKSKKFSKDKLAEEIAHATIMLHIVQNKFKISNINIEKHQLEYIRDELDMK